MKQYPKEVLHKIKISLIEEEEKLKKQLKKLSLEDPFTDPDRLNDNAASDTDAKEEVDHERIEALKSDISLNLKQIEEALQRIKKGNYGFCENCKKMIDTERLAAYPTAKFCMSCQTLRKK